MKWSKNFTKRPCHRCGGQVHSKASILYDAVYPVDYSAVPCCCGVCCLHSVMHFNGGGEQPSKISLLLGDPDPHLIHGSVGPSESTTQMASRSVQPFLYGSRMWPTDTHTDRLKLHLQKEATSLHSVRVMWLNNKVTLNGKIITPHQVHHRQHQHYVFSYEGQSKSFATSYLS